MNPLSAPAPTVHDALGHRFELDIDHDVLQSAASDVLRCLRVGTDGAPAHRYRIAKQGAHLHLERDGVPLARADDACHALRLLLWHVTDAAMAGVHDGLALHAAAVDVGGEVVVLPGASGAGKSTLAAGMALRGASVLGDELTVIDPGDLTVRSLARALCLKRGSWPLLPDLRGLVHPDVAALVDDEWLVPLDRIGPVTASAPVGIIAFPLRVPGSAARLDLLGRNRAVRLLAAATFRLRERPAATLGMIDALARDGRCHLLVHDDLDDACDLLSAVGSPLPRLTA